MNGKYWLLNRDWSGKSFKVSREEIIENLEGSYKITMRLGELAFRVIYLHDFNIPEIKFTEFLSDTVRNIYPTNRNGIKWPPKEKLNDLHELNSSLVYLDNMI